MSRKIIVASPATRSAKTITTDATTLAELKQNAEFASLYNDGLEAIVGATRVTLSRDEATLPEGDFAIYLVAKKNKAGASSDLLTLIKDSIDESNENLREELHDLIDSYFDGYAVPSATRTTGLTAEEAAALSDAQNL